MIVGLAEMTSPTPHLQHPKYRPDIDGLRAVAVLSVVAFHAFPAWAKGGFIGVDIFFVISGFLISTIIFENLDKGTFNFAQFYGRRIKRIFPALLLVLIASFAFGWFALLADEYKQLGKHIAAGAGFVSNFILLREAGYFDNSAETKPLLHLWSLGVEEQFYIVWPFVLWLAWKRKFNLLMLTTLVALVSFYLNLRGIEQDAVATFYSPQTRFWELLSGSILAWFVTYKKITFCHATVLQNSGLNPCLKLGVHFSKTLESVVALIGSLLIAYGFWRITKDATFPGKWAVIPVLGTILIIIAGPQAWINRKILSNRIVVWFGLISYPLYLWHWPLLSFARIVEGEVPSRNIRIASIVLSVMLAWLTYTLVERPIRLGKGGKAMIPTLVVIIVIIGCVGYRGYASDGLKSRQIIKDLKTDTRAMNNPTFEKNMEKCRNFVGNSLSDNCLTNQSFNYPSKFDFYFIGDSHSLALSSSLIHSDINFLSLGRGGCLPFEGIDRFFQGRPYHCEVTFDKIYNFILGANDVNSTVFLSARFAAYIEGSGYGLDEIRSQPSDSIHIQQAGELLQRSNDLYIKSFKLGLSNTLSIFIKSFSRVVIVLQVPELGFDPRKCINRPFRINNFNCAVAKEDVLLRQHSYRKAIAEVLVSFPSVVIFDPIDLFCDTSYCYARRDGMILYRDGDHINNTFGSKLVIDGLRSKGLLP